MSKLQYSAHFCSSVKVARSSISVDLELLGVLEHSIAKEEWQRRKLTIFRLVVSVTLAFCNEKKSVRKPGALLGYYLYKYTT